MAVVEYDGSEYYGFQRQSARPSIQATIEQSLLKITQQDIKIVGSGRTDAGTHALGQVVSFRVTWTRSLSELQRAMNAVLPNEIVFRRMCSVAEDFHARFSAKSRLYRYSILTQTLRSPLHRAYAHHVSTPLDVEIMSNACTCLVGTHDLASFATSEVSSTVRTIYSADCILRNGLVRIDITLNGAFSHLIRRLAGTLLWVGTGKKSPDFIATILEARNPSLSAPPAPAHGLCLVQVNY